MRINNTSSGYLDRLRLKKSEKKRKRKNKQTVEQENDRLYQL